VQLVLVATFTGIRPALLGPTQAVTAKRYDFVPYMDLPDGWFTKDGNSYCF